MSKGYLGIEVSDRVLRYLYVRRSRGRYQATASGMLTLRVDTTAPGSLAKVVRDVLEREQIRPARIAVTMSRREAVVHQAVLPKMHNRELVEAVQAEIEKLPLFRNRDFESIFEAFPGEKDKQRVIFAALDSATAQFCVDEIRQIDSKFREMEISPLNLVQLISSAGKGPDHKALLVVQERLSYFIIFRKGEYRLLYSSRIGQQDLSPEGTDKVDATSLTNLALELKRVMKSFFLENKTEEKIEQFWVVADRDAVIDLDRHLSSQLERRVDMLDMGELDWIVTAEGQPPLNPIFVLAATPMLLDMRNLKPRFPLDHFFSGYQLQKYMKKVGAVAAVYLLIVGLVLGQSAWMYFQKAGATGDKIATTKNETKRLRNDNADLYAKYNEYRAIRAELLAQATYLQTINRVSWSQALAVVAKEMPEELSLTAFEFSDKGRAEFEGQAFQMESVAELMRRVDSSEILGHGQFDYLTEKDLEEQKIFDFGILGQLRPDAPVLPGKSPAGHEGAQP